MPKRKMNLKFISVVVLCLGILPLQAQNKGTIIDEIVAMVGDEVVLRSEVEANVSNAKAERKVSLDGDVEAQVIENMLMSKLMKAQAEVDSIVVTADEVERQLDQRINQYLKYAGSKEKLEQYFKKEMPEIRNELRDATRDQLIIEKMQNEIVKDVKVTPAEVRAYYNKMAKDSLPLMPEKVMIQQITRKPEISQQEKDRIHKQ
ncbi:MAG: peptidylprolyl isomerase, partial [Bacteroidia bacterium]